MEGKAEKGSFLYVGIVLIWRLYHFLQLELVNVGSCFTFYDHSAL